MLTTREGVCTKRFWHFVLILYFGMFYGSFFSSAYKFLPGGKISDAQLSNIGAISSIFNGAARLFWGKMLDSYNFKKIMFVVLPMQIFVTIMVNLVSDNAILYGICQCWTFANQAAFFSTVPPAGVKIFGINSGPQIVTLMLFAVPFSSMTGFVVTGFLNQE